MQVQLPAVFTVTRDLNNPRALSFSGIIKARKKEINRMDCAQLGAKSESLGLQGSPTIVSALNAQEESKRQAEMIAGTREEKADILVQKLVEAGVL
jgi:electron transfer flavoprotein beta subunit